MAQTMYCDACGSEPAAVLVTLIEKGDVQAVCGPCLPQQLAVMLVMAAGLEAEQIVGAFLADVKPELTVPDPVTGDETDEDQAADGVHADAPYTAPELAALAEQATVTAGTHTSTDSADAATGGDGEAGPPVGSGPASGGSTSGEGTDAAATAEGKSDTLAEQQKQTWDDVTERARQARIGRDA